MIHRSSRDALALGLRQYAAKHITNDDLDSIEVDWRDRGAVAVKEMAWRLYDDNYQHRADGRHAFTKEGKRMIARWVVFLHSDQEYIWPEYSFIAIVNWPLSILTFGWWGRREQRRWREFMEAGEFDAWPFVSTAKLHEAAASPRLLAKRDA